MSSQFRISDFGFRISASSHSRRGFTLLEILVVVMIITILAAIVGVNVAREPGKARVMAARTQMGIFKQALHMYRMDQGTLPTQMQGLLALCEKPTTPPLPSRYPQDGYLDSRNLPKDPWGRDFIYLVPGPDGAPYEIISYGADGEIGGDGEAADVSSREL
jgi:general secretion pathway protein G